MVDAVAVPGRESAAAIGESRSRYLRQRLTEELGHAMAAAGLSFRAVARKVGVSPARIERAMRGDASAMTLDLVARIAAIVGLQLAASLHPNGDPVRDEAHLALLNRFRARLPAGVKWRTEVPMPIAGDLRAGDACIDLPNVLILIEAETRLSDLQAVERKSVLKVRDLGADRLILLVSDTPHNRRVLALHPEIRGRFAISQRRCLAALSHGEDPGGDAIVIL